MPEAMKPVVQFNVCPPREQTRDARFPSLNHNLLRTLLVLALALVFLTPSSALSQCAPVPSDLVAWWRAEGDAADAQGANDGLAIGGLTDAAGKVGQAFDFDGIGQYVELANSPSLSPSGSFTIETWVFPRTDQGASILSKWGDEGDYSNQRSFSFGTDSGRRLGFAISDAARQLDEEFHHFRSDDDSITLGVWNHVAAVYDQAAGARRLYVNGVKVAERIDPPITVLDSLAKAAIGAVLRSSTSAQFLLDGLIDEVAFYHRALTDAELQTIYDAGGAGKCVESASPCDSLPDLLNNLEGYWPFNGDGADGSGLGRTMLLEGEVGFDAGLFGQALDLPRDNSQYAIRPGDDSSYNFGSSDFTVQVWVNFNSTSGEQVLIEKFTGGGGPGWTFTKLSDNSLQFYGSSGGSLTLGTSISAGEWHQLVARRADGTLTLFHNGVPLGGTGFGVIPDSVNPLLIGRRNSGDGRDFSLDGRLDEVGIWRRGLSDQEIECLYNGGLGRSLEDFATPPCIVPLITAQPTSQTVCPNTEVTFIIVATGSGLSYQWIKDGSDLLDQTADTLTIAPVSSSDAGLYSVRVSNACGEQTSTVAELTVDGSVLISQGKSVTGSSSLGGFTYGKITDGQYNDTESASGVSYWLTPDGQTGWAQIDLGTVYQVDVLRVQNTHNRTYHDRGTANFSIELSTDGVSYTAVVSGTLASVWGLDPIPFETFPISLHPARFVRFNVETFYGLGGGLNELEVYGLGCDTPECIPPAILANPQPQSVCPNTPAAFTVQASGTEPLTYQWFKNGEEIVGQTTSTLSLPAVQFGDVGDYTVRVENACGSVESLGATLSIVDNPPVVTLNGSSSITVEACAAYNDLGASAPDDCDGILPVSDDSNEVNTSEPGTYVVSYSATDSSLQTTTITRTVIVQDTTPPVLANVPENLTLACNVADKLTQIDNWLASVTATDTCGSATVANNFGALDDCDSGSRTVTWTATDSSGNAATVSRTLTITPNGLLTGVQFAVPSLDVTLTANGIHAVNVTILNPGDCPAIIQSAAIAANFDLPALSVASPTFPATVCPGESLQLTLAINTVGALEGEYAATLSLQGPDGGSVSLSIQVLISGQLLPDITANYSGGGVSVTPETSPVIPAPGEDFTVKATVKNIGTADAGAFTVKFFEGANLLGTAEVAGLAIAQETIAQLPVPGGLAEGWYLIRVEVVPPESGELRLKNNLASALLQVGTPPVASAAVQITGAVTPNCDLTAGTLNLHAEYVLESGDSSVSYPMQGAYVSASILGTELGVTGEHTDVNGNLTASISLPAAGSYTVAVEVTDFSITGQTSLGLDVPAAPNCVQGGLADDSGTPDGGGGGGGGGPGLDLYLCSGDIMFYAEDGVTPLTLPAVQGTPVQIAAAINFYTEAGLELNAQPVHFIARRQVDGMGSEIFIGTALANFAGGGSTVVRVPWTVPADGTYSILVALAPTVSQDPANDKATRGFVVGNPPSPDMVLNVFADGGGCGAGNQWLSGRATYATTGAAALPVICGQISVTAFSYGTDPDNTDPVFVGTRAGFKTDAAGNFYFSPGLDLPFGRNTMVVTVSDGTLTGTTEFTIECLPPGSPAINTPPEAQGDLYVFAEHLAFLNPDCLTALNRNPLSGETISINAALQYWDEDGIFPLSNVPVAVNVLIPSGDTLASIPVGTTPADFEAGGGAEIICVPWTPTMHGPQLIQVVIDPESEYGFPFTEYAGNNAATKLIYVGQLDCLLTAMPQATQVAAGDSAAYVLNGEKLGDLSPTLELTVIPDAGFPPGVASTLGANAITLPDETTLTLTTTSETPPGIYYFNVIGTGDNCAVLARVKLEVLDTTQPPDTTPPQISCPPNLAAQCDTDVPPANFAGGSVSDDTDPSPVVTHVSDVPSGTAPKTIVRTYQATDDAGNTTTCTQTITVHDTTPPVVTLLGEEVVTIECHGSFDDPGATAVDNCVGDLTASIIVSGSVNANVPGPYTLTYTVTDPAGNVGTATRTVNVVDTTAPTLTLSGASSMTVECHSAFTDPGATASDACAGNLTAAIAVTGSVDVNTPDSYTLTYTVEDPAGLVATATRTVNVVDTTAPNVTLIGNAVMTVECHTSFTDPGATANDICAGTLSVVTTGAVNVNTPGSYTLTYTATDPSGNAASATRTVNVVDTTPPVIVLVGANPLVLEIGSTYTEPGATASDLCAGDLTASLVINASAVNTAVAGSYSVTYDVTDPAGNPAAQVTRTVIVQDTGVPVLTLLGDNPQVIECSSAYMELGATAHDAADGDLTDQIIIDAIAVDTSTPGDYLVTYRVSDSAGNSVQATRTVTVVDTTSPVVTLLGNDAMTVECHGSFTDPGATANDACAGELTVSVSGTVNVNTPGSYVLTYTATDPANNLGTATRTVTVVDTTPPVVTLVGDAVITVECHGTFSDPGATAADVCSGDLTAAIVGTGSVDADAPGEYVLTYTATDAAGNSASAIRTVKVRDTTAPVVALLGDAAMTVECHGTFNDPGATADDVCAGQLTVTVSGTVDVNTPGSYTLTYAATDPAGNAGSATRTVTVQDTTPPLVTCPAPSQVIAGVNCQVALPDLRATTVVSDSCSATTETIISQQPEPGTALTLGTHTVTLTATDAAGNTATCTTTVTVVDETAPEIVCPAPRQIVADANCQALLPDLTSSALATDCSGTVTVSQSPAAGTPIGLGVQTVTLTATDAAGITASCTVEVTVLDQTAPEIACPGPVQLPADENGQAPTPDFLNALLVTDNCSATVTASQSPPAGSLLATGAHEVLITVTDEAGNQATCTVLVTVSSGDNTAPLVTIEQPASGHLSAISQGIQFVGSFTDDGPSGSHTAQWVISSAALPETTIPGTVSGFTVADTIQFPEAGVYSIKLVVTDADGASGDATEVLNDLPAYMVVYDPSGGFVTGGGWIWSPLGAFHPGLEEFSAFEGKANFGFVSKYKPGAKVPTGQTEFQFHAGGLNFHSGDYQWLVVAGARAQYKGTGTINGAGVHGFMVTAIDGQINGGGGKDRFRIKIWDARTGIIIYDNQAGSSDADDLNDATILRGGSIVIHKQK